ncbi:MAG: SDR family NAD(P)-dependent oxidoreductase [Rhizomicrobium sp.]
MIDDVLRAFGAIDILVNNAVVRHVAPIEAFAGAAWDESIAVNLSAAFHTMRLALPRCGSAAGAASSMSVRSTAPPNDRPRRLCRIQDRLLGLTRAVALEAAGAGITVNCICPGTAETPVHAARIDAMAAADAIPRAAAERRFLSGKTAYGPLRGRGGGCGTDALPVRPRRARRDRRRAAGRRRLDRSLMARPDAAAPFAAQLAAWSGRVRFEDIPADVVHATQLRVLDVIGLIMAGTRTRLGRSARAASVAMSAGGSCRILGFGDKVGVTAAAFANGALSQSLQYDETHIESIVHASSPVVAAALAIADWRGVTGREFVTAVALGNEIACRIGCVAPGEFHRRGLHPTGLFTTFGCTYLAAMLLRLDPERTVHAAGIAGSFASGILQCWVDGTETQFLHPGWSAKAGIEAAVLAREGATGPAEVFEGRLGFFAAHLQDASVPRDFTRIAGGLGEVWASRASSFKPYPVAHVIHPYIDALLRLAGRHKISAADVDWIDCPVPQYIVPIVCEPVAEKTAPVSDFHGRVSLQYTLAEAWCGAGLGARPTAKSACAIRRFWLWRGASAIASIPDSPDPAGSRARSR